MLTPDGSFLLILVLFLVFVPIINKVLFQPIVHVLDERERRTGGSDTDVAAMLGTIDRKLVEYEEGVREARGVGYRVIEQRRTTALEERQKAIAAARSSAEEKIAGARDTISRDADAARERLTADAREIATTISSTVLGRSVGGAR